MEAAPNDLVVPLRPGDEKGDGSDCWEGWGGPVGAAGRLAVAAGGGSGASPRSAAVPVGLKSDEKEE